MHINLLSNTYRSFNRLKYDISFYHYCRMQRISYSSMINWLDSQGLTVPKSNPAFSWDDGLRTNSDDLLGLNRGGRLIQVNHPLSNGNSNVEKLACIITDLTGLDPYNGDTYIFTTTTNKSLFMLQWQRGGFMLIEKKAQMGRFQMQMSKNGKNFLMLTPHALNALLNLRKASLV